MRSQSLSLSKEEEIKSYFNLFFKIPHRYLTSASNELDVTCYKSNGTKFEMEKKYGNYLNLIEEF